MLNPRHGLYILAARDIFTMLRKPENEYLTAWIGLYEIYQGQLYDLLNERKKLFAREDGKSNVIITGLKEYPIDNVDKLIQIFEYGSSVRTTGKRSSRHPPPFTFLLSTFQVPRGLMIALQDPMLSCKSC